MKNLSLLFFLIFLATNTANSQIRRSYWSADVILSTNSFLSDLGGKNADGSNDFRDVDINKTTLAIGGGFTLNGGSGLGFSVGGFYTRLSASDFETESPRTPRQLTVRTDIIEGFGKFQYTFPQRSLLPGIYFNAGVGITYFEPKAQWNGIWYKLRPLGTEGQLADPTKQVYDPYTLIIPFGIGKKFYLKNGVAICADLSLRKTFTDYLDDVSTVYYDNNAIQEKAGVAAAYFANPSDDPRAGREGNIRGNPNNNDNYFLFGFKLEIPLNGAGMAGNMNTSCSFQNGWVNSYGGVPKIRRGGYRRRLFR